MFKVRMTGTSRISIDISQNCTRLAATAVLEGGLEPDFIFFPLLPFNSYLNLGKKKKKKKLIFSGLRMN